MIPLINFFIWISYICELPANSTKLTCNHRKFSKNTLNIDRTSSQSAVSFHDVLIN